MNVIVSPDLQAFVQARVASGRNVDPNDVLVEALLRLRDLDREQADLLAALDIGEARAASEGVVAWSPHYMDRLVEDVRTAANHRNGSSGSR